MFIVFFDFIFNYIGMAFGVVVIVVIIVTGCGRCAVRGIVGRVATGARFLNDRRIWIKA